jgi:hypothetical protein
MENSGAARMDVMVAGREVPFSIVGFIDFCWQIGYFQSMIVKYE